VRTGITAATTLLLACLLASPVVDVLVLHDGAHWLLAYLVLAALSALSTALAVLITVGLFRIAGPRRTRLIILDEPLTGLDAGSARQVKDVLKQKVAQGVTVIMTTHILEVAERMAERIGVINHGRLVAEGTLTELRAMIGRETTLEEIFLDLVALKEMDADPGVDAAA
jgi:ABC-type sugar transport system ATPase subunit